VHFCETYQEEVSVFVVLVCINVTFDILGEFILHYCDNLLFKNV